MTYAGSSRYSLVEGWPRRPADVQHRDVTGVGIDSSDRVYMLTRYPGQVVVYNADGSFEKTWGRGIFTTPHGLTIGPDESVYCTDAGDHTVRKFTLDGRLLMTLGTPGLPSDTGYRADRPIRVHSVERVLRPAGPFNRCTSLAVAPDGGLYVADGYGNCCVHRFAPDGSFLGSWGGVGSGPGEFHLPHCIDVSGDGLVYVGDRENDRIQIFSLDGRYIDEWRNIQRPCDLKVCSDGNVYVLELCRPKGAESFVSGPSEVDLPSRLVVLDRQGRVLDRWAGNGNAAGSFIAPHCLALDSAGAMYIGEVTYSFAIRAGRIGPEYGDHQFQKFEKCQGS